MEHIPERIAATVCILTLLMALTIAFADEFVNIPKFLSETLMSLAIVVCCTTVAGCMIWIAWT